MEFFVIISAIVITVIVNVTSMPTVNPDLQDIVSIATQTCHDTNDTVRQSDNIPQNSETVLHQFIQEGMLETMDELNQTVNMMKSWVKELQSESKSTFCLTFSIQINIVHHMDLSAEQNSRLHKLLLMSSYVHFLKSQENDTITYSSRIASQLHSLRRHINNSVVTLGELLPMVTCDAMRIYINEAVSGHLIDLQDTNQATKRTVCYCVLEAMLELFSNDVDVVGN